MNLVISGGRGPRGSIIWPTTGVPASNIGFNGDYAIDDAAGVLYGPKATGAWPAPGLSLIGPSNDLAQLVFDEGVIDAPTNEALAEYLAGLQFASAPSLDFQNSNNSGFAAALAL